MTRFRSTISSTGRIRRILDSRYEKADLNQVMDKQCQHLSPNKLLHILRKFEDLLDGTLCTWKTPLVDVCSSPYPVPIVNKEMSRN